MPIFPLRAFQSRVSALRRSINAASPTDVSAYLEEGPDGKLPGPFVKETSPKGDETRA